MGGLLSGGSYHQSRSSKKIQNGAWGRRWELLARFTMYVVRTTVQQFLMSQYHLE